MFVQTVVLDNDQGAAIAWCYQQGLVLERHDNDETGQIELKLILTLPQFVYLKKLHASQ